MRKQDAKKIEAFFLANHYKIAPKLEVADFIIVVSCGLNETSINLSLNSLSKMPEKTSFVLITGCLPSMVPDKIKLNDKIKLLPIKNINEIDKFFDNIKTPFADINESNFYPEDEVPYRNLYAEKKSDVGNTKHTDTFKLKSTLKKILAKNEQNPHRCTLRISVGCVSNCSYCGIKYAIGNLKSRPIDSIKKDYIQLLKKGYKEFVLLADDTGSYGVDIKTDLPALLNSLHMCDIKGETKWILQDLSPEWALKYKNQLYEFIKIDCFSEIMLSVQNGSDSMLSLMKRRYKVSDVVDLVINIRRLNSKMLLMGNVIIGFPSETEEDFNLTLEFISKCNFDFIYLMKYYENQVCESRNIYPKVPDGIIENRLNKIEKILEEKQTVFFTIK